METVLLAGPDPILLAWLRSALRLRRIETHLCGTEQEFVACCESGVYRLIVTQFIHPFLNGSDLGTRLKSGKENAFRPAVWVLTPVQHEQLLVSLYENGADRCFALPADLTRLCGRIETQLAGETP